MSFSQFFSYFRQIDITDGKALVSDLYGSGNIPRNRSLTNVTTLQSVDYPADNGVKFLTVFCSLYKNVIGHALTTGAAATVDFGTTGNISKCHRGQVYISVTTDTMAITGTRGSQTGIPVHVIAANGTRSAATGLATGTYVLDRLDYDTLTFTKTGVNAVGTVNAQFSIDAADAIKGLIAIDATSDLIAGTWLGTTETDIPSSASDDQFYIPIPLGQFVKVPLSVVMANNQIHVRSSDGTALNFWIGGN